MTNTAQSLFTFHDGLITVHGMFGYSETAPVWAIIAVPIILGTLAVVHSVLSRRHSR